MSVRKHLSVFLGFAALALALLAPTVAQADFGIVPGSFSAKAENQDGSTDTEAGAHPYQYTVKWDMNLKGIEEPDGNLSSLVVHLPPGFVGNPQALPTCSRAQFEGDFPHCPANTQIGSARITVGVFGLGKFPVYNTSAPNGRAAMLGLSVFNVNSFQEASVRTGSDYGIDINDITVPTGLDILSIEETIWGVPADESHAPERSCRVNEAVVEGGCQTDAEPAPFLSLPTSCGGPLETSLDVESLQEPGVIDSASYLSLGEAEEPVGLTGCNQLEFNPNIEAKPTTNVADSPSGLNFDLHVPQAAPVEGLAQTDTCNTGTWSGEPDEFVFQWLRNGTPIPGATSPVHEVEAADAGTLLQCEVSAENGAIGPGHAISIAHQVSPKPKTAPPAAKEPTIVVNSGTATCQPENWGGAPSFSYQWYENGTLLAGQTQATHPLPSPPYTLQCRVSGANGGGTVVAFSANQTSTPPLAPALPNSTKAPQVLIEEEQLPPATAHLKDTTITLPKGLVVNPASANGLGACSMAQMGITTGVGVNPIHTTEGPATCPDAAKLGTVEVKTPLLANPLPGNVYIAAPYQNPFNSLLALYIAVHDPLRGVVVKLAGEVRPDPQTGQLTTTFNANPQQPVEDFRLNFFGGAGGALRTPAVCGTYQAASRLTPWSSPEGADATPSDSFAITQAPSGSCPQTEGARANKPAFGAGTLAPKAGAYSPFILRLTRQDGSQELKGIDATLPKGLSGKLAGVPYCSEAQIAQAISREKPNQGTAEQQSPSCPAASEVGTVTVGAGAGPSPYYAQGHAYLAPPYKGAPLSLAIITPAVAGPFDLGAVVVRTALNVDPETAQIHAVSDPLPTILAGIPLDVKSIAVNLSRNQFSLNPTSCDPMSVLATSTSALGQSAALSSPFQVGECAKLGFKPQLKIKLKGGTKRGDHPALSATVTYPKGSYANIASASVGLPHSEFLDQSHIKTICTRVQFAAHQCPKGAIYGYAKATTPLLDKPLEGPVYLRSSSHELPDLVAELNGQVQVVVAGRVDTNSKGGLRNTFEATPDAPISKFTLQMQGGKKGLLVNSENTCLKPQRAIARFSAQNGKRSDYEPLIDNGCQKQAKKHKKRGH